MDPTQENSTPQEIPNLEFPQENPQETSELSDFGNQFLTNVPDEDKPILEKYIKDWDGNVTRKFQEYSGKIKQYEDLGDPSDLANAYQVLQDLREDPVGFFEYYREYLTENADSISELYGVEDLLTRLGVNNTMETNETTPPVVDESTAMIQSLQAELQEAKGEIEKINASTREKEQMAMLDSTLSKMHTEHGDFDETFVLSQIASGRSPQEAIKAFHDLKQSIIDSQGESAPKLLSGPAGTPLDQVDKTKLKDAKTRKELGAALLERSLKSN